ncbi:hypothetical protein TYRP_000001, partial [Tyrophagus putrescentiae]
CQRPSPRVPLASLARPSSTDVDTGQVTSDLAVCQLPSPRVPLASLARPSSTDVDTGQVTSDLAVVSCAPL